MDLAYPDVLGCEVNMTAGGGKLAYQAFIAGLPSDVSTDTVSFIGIVSFFLVFICSLPKTHTQRIRTDILYVCVRERTVLLKCVYLFLLTGLSLHSTYHQRKLSPFRLLVIATG